MHFNLEIRCVGTISNECEKLTYNEKGIIKILLKLFLKFFNGFQINFHFSRAHHCEVYQFKANKNCAQKTATKNWTVWRPSESDGNRTKIRPSLSHYTVSAGKSWHIRCLNLNAFFLEGATFTDHNWVHGHGQTSSQHNHSHISFLEVSSLQHFSKKEIIDYKIHKYWTHLLRIISNLHYALFSIFLAIFLVLTADFLKHFFIQF